MKMKTLKQVTPNWIEYGIFTALQELNVPWKNENAYTELDFYFYTNYGLRYISPVTEELLGTSESLSTESIDFLALVAFKIFGKNWEKEWNTIISTYNPIENYHMIETMTDDTTTKDYGKTTTRTDNLSHQKTGTETQGYNNTENSTLTPNVTVTNEKSVYGFDDSDNVPSETTEQGTSGTNTENKTKTGQDTLTHNVSDIDTGTQSHVDSGTDTETRNYTLERSGNIGVTTSQQMLEAERNLWMWNYYENVVFPDLKNFLTIKIY